MADDMQKYLDVYDRTIGSFGWNAQLDYEQAVYAVIAAVREDLYESTFRDKARERLRQEGRQDAARRIRADADQTAMFAAHREYYARIAEGTE